MMHETIGKLRKFETNKDVTINKSKIRKLRK